MSAIGLKAEMHDSLAIKWRLMFRDADWTEFSD